ncbi:MAG: transcriptional repressor [Planctomycetes bacterium]|nr:transcriptional repressor [Planctomycetota bacterium]MBL7009231.1 transcriptional repressor [Planctomycetota bacterium]
MKSDAALSRFEGFLRRKGLRVTDQRREILNAAWATHDHFSAEELYGWLRGAGSKASRATVYRTLTLLVEGGFLSALDGGKGQMLYEHILGHSHHDHMICLKCGKIIEFRNEEIEGLQHAMAAKHRFRLIQHTLTLEGYCSACHEALTRAGPGS